MHQNRIFFFGNNSHAIKALKNHGFEVEQKKNTDAPMPGVQIIIEEGYLSGSDKLHLIESSLDKNLTISIAPLPENWNPEKAPAGQLYSPSVLDLFPARDIELDEQALIKLLRGKRILITGSAGSIGSALAKRVLKYQPELLILLDQNETGIFEQEVELDAVPGQASIATALADIRDYGALEQVFSRHHPQIIFHTAAGKHVPLMERFPHECIKTNIIGTENVAELSIRHGAEKFIFISTDKATNPAGVLGASKKISETFIEGLNRNQSGTGFSSVRFGNVISSNGSVIPLIENQVRKRLPVKITHPEATRYFISIDDACSLILAACHIKQDNDVLMLEMGKAVNIYDLAKKIISLHNLQPDKDICITFTGLRPGEKLHEELTEHGQKLIPSGFRGIVKLQNEEVVPFDHVKKAISGLKSQNLSTPGDLARVIMETERSVSTGKI